MLALREEQIPEPGSPCQRLEHLHDRVILPRAEALRLLIESKLVRIDMRRHEIVEPYLQLKNSR